jgi:GT2 family glycosyltransferase
LVPCTTGNANVLLIDIEAINKIGIFSDAYIHIFADFDYTLSAHKAGLKVLIAPGYYGYCEREYFIKWPPPKMPLKARIKYLYHTKGLGYKEHLYFVKKHFPSAYFTAFFKIWMKTLFPIIWHKFRKREPAIESSNTK